MPTTDHIRSVLWLLIENVLGVKGTPKEDLVVLGKRKEELESFGASCEDI